MVRKKAVMALLRFYHLYPSAVEDIKDRLQSALCDRDPSVMTAALTAYLTFVSVSSLC